MVKLERGSIKQLKQRLENKECYCFGSGDQAELFFVKHDEMLENIKGFIDNDERKAGQKKVILGKQIPVFSFPQFIRLRNQKTVVITTSMYWLQMIEQMDGIQELENMPCYVDIVAESMMASKAFFVMEKMRPPQIPKIIHYCWFGEKEIPKTFQKNILSWKQCCKDYEIVRWDESNYDVSKCDYMNRVYKAEKWAFVSDYARLDILNQYGGIYLDTDVELIKPLDIFLGNRMFFGFEQNQCIGSGLGCGSVKNQDLLQDMMELYHQIPAGESMCSKKAYAPLFQTQIMKERGFRLDGTYQNRDGVALYPSEVFSPMNLWSGEILLTENTYAIHHYSSTWWEKEAVENVDRMRGRLQDYLKRMEQVG